MTIEEGVLGADFYRSARCSGYCGFDYSDCCTDFFRT